MSRRIIPVTRGCRYRIRGARRAANPRSLPWLKSSHQRESSTSSIKLFSFATTLRVSGSSVVWATRLSRIDLLGFSAKKRRRRLDGFRLEAHALRVGCRSRSENWRDHRTKEAEISGAVNHSQNASFPRSRRGNRRHQGQRYCSSGRSARSCRRSRLRVRPGQCLRRQLLPRVLRSGRGRAGPGREPSRAPCRRVHLEEFEIAPTVDDQKPVLRGTPRVCRWQRPHQNAGPAADHLPVLRVAVDGLAKTRSTTSRMSTPVSSMSTLIATLGMFRFLNWSRSRPLP